MWFAVLSLARKFQKSRKADNTTATADTLRSRKGPGAARYLAILPVVIIIVAFILSFLCVFAGNKPGFHEEYFVLRLNTSRIGQNIIQKVDNKISSVTLDLKRDITEPTVAATTVSTIPSTTLAAPTSLITIAPRDLSDLTDLSGHLTSEVGAAASNVHSAITSKETAIHSAITSKASAFESAAASHITSAIGSLQTKVIAAINNAYADVLADLALSDFYDIHVSSTCKGTYQYHNGTNVTLTTLTTTTDPTNPNLHNTQIHAHVDTCTTHSPLDPMSLIRIIYWAGIISTGIALSLSITGLILPSRKLALFNCLATLPAFFFLFLASAVTHGIAMGAAKFINFMGGDVGIRGDKGGKFIALTWACTALVLVHGVCWGFLVWMRGRAEKDLRLGAVPSGLASSWRGRSMRKPERPDRTSAVVMEGLARPQAAHDVHGAKWI
ncbi:hypothetical protein B0A50_01141 [Salinomyces thailandicus]|uniref:Actin cortical patch SUR7/pH-response regulator PalI n=1 Tax=Salinomyces thailandicus TaxID=706561 RepID=A0A4U0UET6_9PEZI|nr:hypothetical protein B0A50_01141 [Salinomyces thailandica]